MRWLLAKDLVILRRSRLLVAILVIYPIAIALLIGLAISRSPGKPSVAIVDETPPGQTIGVGGRRVEVGRYAEQVFDQVRPVRVGSREQAVKDIEDGRVLAAVVIPRDIAAKVSSGVSQGSVEVLYNGNALEQSLVQAQLSSALAQANLGFSEQIQRAASQAIGALIEGGNAQVLGAPPNMIGLSQIPARLRRLIARTPPGAEREQLRRIEAFATFANQNLGAARSVLATIGQPIQIRSTPIQGRRTPLNTFAVVVAVSVSLMFVCVLLAAGGLALEREEHVLARILRGPPAPGPPALLSREGLLAEKLLLAGACGFVLALAMLVGVGAFVSLDWSRFAGWLVALACGAVAFGALGVAIGALAREVRAASLLAFGLALPLAFLALVPSGAVAHGIYMAISAISFAFPFKAALQALDAAVNGASPGLGVSVAHLLGLSVLFAALARLGMRRLE
ncbi:MAG TPA: ABC transporter permease [Solirubrobacteraceae bacterium]|nr:ABC transporter permease [Solirubrobacteraceae bacterium]